MNEQKKCKICGKPISGKKIKCKECFNKKPVKEVPVKPGQKVIPVSEKQHGVWKVVNKVILSKSQVKNKHLFDVVGKVIKCKGKVSPVQKVPFNNDGVSKGFISFNPVYVEINGEWKQIKDINVWNSKFKGHKGEQIKELNKCNKPGVEVEFEGKVICLHKKNINKPDFVVEQIQKFHVVQ